MARLHGDFVWYELLTSDPGGAAAFYGRVLGWRVRPFAGSVPGYSYFEAGGEGVAGLMQAPEHENDLSPAWHGYVAVDDLDAALDSAGRAGGSVRMAPMEIAGVGRIAMLADPQGVPIYAMRPADGMRSVSFQPNTVGHCAWNELVTTDQEAALAFHTAQFGWTRGDVMPMPGSEGGYRFLEKDGAMIGAVMNRMAPDQPIGWTFAFRVDAIDEAAGAVTEGGGAVRFGPAEIPGGEFVVNATDPQGARFMLVGPRG